MSEDAEPQEEPKDDWYRPVKGKKDRRKPNPATSVNPRERRTQEPPQGVTR